jgi:hypothetical protein
MTEAIENCIIGVYNVVIVLGGCSLLLAFLHDSSFNPASYPSSQLAACSTGSRQVLQAKDTKKRGTLWLELARLEDTACYHKIADAGPSP